MEKVGSVPTLKDFLGKIIGVFWGELGDTFAIEEDLNEFRVITQRHLGSEEGGYIFIRLGD